MKFFYLLKKLIKSNLVFTPPTSKKILIYDAVGSDLFFNFFKKEDCEIFYTRFEKINVLVLFLSLFNFNGKLSRSYAHTYIKYVKPSLIITYIHNRVSFYKLKNYFKDTKIIAVQNGLGNDVFEVFKNIEKKDNLYIDYLFAIDEVHKKYYSKFVKGTVLSTGSLKNNLVPILKKREEIKNLVFISQYKYPESFEYTYNTDSWGLTPSYDEFTMAEKKLIPMLVEYCKKNNIRFEICGRTNSNKELQFFKSLMPTNNEFSNYIFHPRKNLFESYKIIDQSSAVVHINSTLGYEALSRKKPVAAFSVRGENIKHIAQFGDFSSNCYSFGLPKKFPDKGPFWSNYLDKDTLNEILNLVLDINEEEWIKIYKKYALDITAYDEDNKEFKNIIKSLNIPLA